MFGTIYHCRLEMVHVLNNTQHIDMNTISTDNPRKDWVYLKLTELSEAVMMDSFNFTRDDQDSIDVKIQELKRFLDEKYAGN